MGAWGVAPWDNDKAVEWHEEMFQNTGLGSFIKEYLVQTKVTSSNHEEVRAATTIALMLARAYVWPIEALESVLEIADKRLSEVEQLEIVQMYGDLLNAVQRERHLIQARLPERNMELTTEDTEYWKSLT